MNHLKHINEISKELIDNAANIMIDKNQKNRAEELKKKYDNKCFSEFLGKELSNDDIIYEIRYTPHYTPRFGPDGKENIVDIKLCGLLRIIYGSNLDKQYNRKHGSIFYNIDEDSFFHYPKPINRKTARLLSLIAKKVKPETKYGNGVGDFEISGY